MRERDRAADGHGGEGGEREKEGCGLIVGSMTSTLSLRDDDLSNNDGRDH